MYMSKLIGKTLKKANEDYNFESQSLLLRAGMIRKIDHGYYSLLPMGVKTIDNITRFLSDHLEELGFQKIHMAAIPYEIEKNLYLSFGNEIKSYKDLPGNLYEIRISEREEIKARDGIMNSKNFIELKGYGFYEDARSLIDSYENIKDLLKRLLDKVGLSTYDVNTYNEKTMGFEGHKIIVPIENGDSNIYTCEKCGYTVSEEVAWFHVEEKYQPYDKDIEKIYTPDIKTIKELEDFLKIEAASLAKTLLVKASDEIIAIVLRGDRELNLYKLSNVLKVPLEEIEMADEEDIKGSIKTATGFVGPVGLENVKVIVDREIAKQGPWVTGSNEKDYHFKNVKYGKDFKGDIVDDVSYIKENDRCPICSSKLQKISGIAIVNILNLNNELSKRQRFSYLDQNGKTQDVYGITLNIDIYRLFSCIAEKYHDDYGIIWPMKVAPYHVIISILNMKKEEQVDLGQKLYSEMRDSNIKVLLDDRNERAGAKFNDADLLGIPIRITVGKGAKEKKVEYKLRWEKEREELKGHEALGKTLKLLKKEEVL